MTLDVHKFQLFDAHSLIFELVALNIFIVGVL